jgi:uncharacterized protein (TIGR02147 family)
MVVSGKRALSRAAWMKLSPHLGLSASEKQFFEHLLTLGTSDSHDARVKALDKMKRSSRYSQQNPKDTEVYQYLTHWYYVAIRELAVLSNFQEDPEWIQSRLRYPVPLQEIKQAMEFLLQHKYLERDPNGRVRAPEISLDCTGGIYRIALGQFHKELLELAAQSIDATPSEERSLVGHTCTLSPKSWTKAQQIVLDAIAKIQKLGADETEGNSVYHMEVALFPLSQSERSSK